MDQQSRIRQVGVPSVTRVEEPAGRRLWKSYGGIDTLLSYLP